MSINLISKERNLWTKKKEVYCLTQKQKEMGEKKTNSHLKDMEWRNSDLFLLIKQEKGKVC